MGIPEKKGTSVVPLQICQGVNSPARIIVKIHTYRRKDNIENHTVNYIANTDEHQQINCSATCSRSNKTNTVKTNVSSLKPSNFRKYDRK